MTAPARESSILGIGFHDGDVDTLLHHALRGGLVVVPSGPGLAQDLRRSRAYRRAVTTADLAIADSGAMVLFWRLFRFRKIRRVSGLRFLEALLEMEELKDVGRTFWVHPNLEQQQVNEAWLRRNGFQIEAEDSSVAPHYDREAIEDPALFESICRQRPAVVVLCIGGGVQEPLGWWLREQFRGAGLPCPAIVCTGAAIGFLSGNQVRIPTWADRLFLGWLFRCMTEPRKFLRRYWSAIPLAWLVLSHGSALPPLKS